MPAVHPVGSAKSVGRCTSIRSAEGGEVHGSVCAGTCLYCSTWCMASVAMSVWGTKVSCVYHVCREVVMLKCTLAEQRKHEQERVEAALRDQKRKIARREARQPTLLEKFLQTK